MLQVLKACSKSLWHGGSTHSGTVALCVRGVIVHVAMHTEVLAVDGQ